MSTPIPPISPVNESSPDDDTSDCSLLSPLLSTTTSEFSPDDDTSDFSLSPLESTTTPDFQLPIRNARHYWESVVLLVGGELFKVPRYHLEKGSSFFQRLLASRDEQPIRLDGTVTATEFETFLDMLYPTIVPSKELTRSQEAWTAILKISTEWQFPHIRQLAIQTLTSMDIDTLTRIKLARDYSVSQWLQIGYTDLVKRVSTLSVEEVESIGYLTAIRIFRVREEMIKMYWNASGSHSVVWPYSPSPSPSPSFSTNHWDDTTIRNAIKEEFLSEMTEVDKKKAVYNDQRETQTHSERWDEFYKNLPVGEKLTEAIRLAREIEEVKGKDMEESEKEKMLIKLWKIGEKRYWGDYNPSEHRAILHVSALAPLATGVVNTIEERLLHLLHPLAKNGDESVKFLDVIISLDKPLIKAAIFGMLTARGLSSSSNKYSRTMAIRVRLPYK